MGISLDYAKLEAVVQTGLTATVLMIYLLSTFRRDVRTCGSSSKSEKCPTVVGCAIVVMTDRVHIVIMPAEIIVTPCNVSRHRRLRPPRRQVGALVKDVEHALSTLNP